MTGILATILLIANFNFTLIEQGTSLNTGINYESQLCIYKNNHLIECNHNVLYDTGKEMIKDILSSGGNQIRRMQLCNATAGCGTPNASSTETFNAMNGCGMAEATGTYGNLSVGNWSIYNKFISTCDNIVTNLTRLRNTSGSNLVGVSFAVVTLQTNDELTLNWTNWVS